MSRSSYTVHNPIQTILQSDEVSLSQKTPPLIDLQAMLDIRSISNVTLSIFL